MLCKVRRTKKDQVLFSDNDGFGFCEQCGTCANAYAAHRINFERGFGSPPRVELLAKSYLKSVETLSKQNPFLAISYTSAFGQWGNNQAWRESWRNVAILTNGSGR
jgi:hypothetical protein